MEDWLMVSGEESKYPGLEIRMSLSGKALEVTEDIARETLTGKKGEQVILQKLDEVYKKDSLMENYGRMKKYFGTQRMNGEKIRDFLIRYETAAAECARAMGRPMLEGEAKGFHVLEQSNLNDQQKQMVIAACGQGTLEYKTVTQTMKRIFEGLGEKEEEQWLENTNTVRERNNISSRGNRGRGRTGRNPLDSRGKVTRCVICSSEWHWAKDCPQSYRNRTEIRPDGAKGLKHVNEEVYIGGVSNIDEEAWEELEAILDTGCRSTVCGER